MMIKLKKNLLDNISSVDKSISVWIYRFGCGLSGSAGAGSDWYECVLRGLEYSCHGIPWFAISIVSLYLALNNKSFGQLLIGLLIDVIVVAVLKASTRRRRPLYARQDDQMLVIGVDKHSFPSGHASRAIYVALFCANHSLVSFFVWIWSLSVCTSRLLLGRHHLLDVLFGAFVGYFVYCLQFVILRPIDSLLLWPISALFNVQFSDTNDFD